MRIIGTLAVAATMAGGMMLAAPAANAAPTIAVPDVNVGIGSFLNAHANSTIDIGLLGNQIVSITDPVDGLLGG